MNPFGGILCQTLGAVSIKVRVNWTIYLPLLPDWSERAWPRPSLFHIACPLLPTDMTRGRRTHTRGKRHERIRRPHRTSAFSKRNRNSSINASRLLLCFMKQIDIARLVGMMFVIKQRAGMVMWLRLCLWYTLCFDRVRGGLSLHPNYPPIAKICLCVRVYLIL